MKYSIFAIALALAGCGTPPGLQTAQQKLDSAGMACRSGVQYIYITNSGYSSSWVIPLDRQGKPFSC